jgi:hypothetical protein
MTSSKDYLLKRRAGISPVIATTIILAITVTMGLALYGFVNSQSSVATQSFAQEATDYINYRNDRFVITSLSFQNNGITAYVFNNGNIPVTINKVLVGFDELNYPCQGTITDSNPIKAKEIGTVIITNIPKHDNSGNVTCGGQLETPPAVYHVKVISEAGSYQTYFQKYEVSN